MLIGVPLLAVAVALLWYASSDPGRQHAPEREALPAGAGTQAPRDFAEQFTGDRVPARAVINGRTFTLEVARDATSRGRGLGGRDAIADDSGMLFIFPQEGLHRFWMKDVGFALDLLYIGRDGAVVDIQTMVPEPGVPDGDLTIYEPSAQALLALEINGGLALRLGIEPGTVVRFE